MGLVSASTQIRIISALHLAIAYHLIFQPKLLDQQGVVVLLGQAMGIDEVVSFSSAAVRPVSSFLGLLFGFIGCSDLIAASIDGIPFYIHWGGQAPIRVTFFFALACLTYVYDANPQAQKTFFTVGLSTLKTNWVFSWAFVEIIGWFSIYSTIREERQAIFIGRENETRNS
ncbi:hypothetical protein TWF173_007689 [Orbilia oligospora]|uniref:Uncharacterized protein n=1 Tax=Orbilia oligospora TaxID=2813651 RepID=A0A7C8V7A8_ORBOL|nr:hypothetical protein TWF970_007877 [Orbilia oligospora]KAF3318255.1 hypothetical protein TWF173_007689 [Orbilia oligospora]